MARIQLTLPVAALTTAFVAFAEISIINVVFNPNLITDENIVQELRKKLYTYSVKSNKTFDMSYDYMAVFVRCVCVGVEGEREDLRKRLYTYSVKSNKTFDMSYDYMAVFVRCVCVGGGSGGRERGSEKEAVYLLRQVQQDVRHELRLHGCVCTLCVCVGEVEGEREDLRKKLYTYSVKSNKTFDMSYDYMAVFVRCVCVGAVEGEREDLRKKLYTYSVKSNKTFDMSYDYMAVFVRCVCVGGWRERERI